MQCLINALRYLRDAAPVAVTKVTEFGRLVHDLAHPNYVVDSGPFVAGLHHYRAPSRQAYATLDVHVTPLAEPPIEDLNHARQLACPKKHAGHVFARWRVEDCSNAITLDKNFSAVKVLVDNSDALRDIRPIDLPQCRTFMVLRELGTASNVNKECGAIDVETVRISESLWDGDSGCTGKRTVTCVQNFPYPVVARFDVVRLIGGFHLVNFVSG